MPNVRVATYNISGGITEDRRFYSKRGTPECTARARRARTTLDGVASLLSEEGIDIAALQEVDVCYSGPDTLHQATYLAERYAAQVEYEPLFDYHLFKRSNVTTGLATLSKSKIVSRKSLPFPQRHVSLKRKLKASLLGAKHALHTVHEVDGELIHIVNAHLTHDIDAQKEYELSLLLDYCSALDPAVLLGDLNTTPSPTRSPGMVEEHHFGADRCMDLLASHHQKHPGSMHFDLRLGAFEHPTPELALVCTYPANRPSIKLDYCIGFSRKPGFALSAERVLPSPLSNHCATSVAVSW